MTREGSCVDVDECATGIHNCSIFAQCINLEGQFECKCDWGFQGDGWTCIDIDECTQNQIVCIPNATCVNVSGSASCVCDPGFEGDGITCTNIDACAEGQVACGPNATCENKPDGASCVCKPGFEGDGASCTDIDECALGPPSMNCSPDATCSNTPGGFSCACKAGFEGDGLACSDINECAQGSSCSTDATCSNTHGGYDCICKTGFQGDGVNCYDIDECAPGAAATTCSPLAHCVNTVGDYYCVCPGGYSGNGTTCQPVTNCSGPMLDGIDVSSHQGTINWQQVKDSGVEFAFIRVAYGKAYLDNKFDANWAGAKNVGIVRGAYQFFRMKHDPIEQAQVFLDNMGPLQPGDLPPVVDIEHDVPQYDDTYYSPASWVLATSEWLSMVENALGVKPIIYASYGFINWLNTSLFEEYPLWEAYWFTSCPSIPNGFNTWVFWQDSNVGEVPGISGDVDLNHFNGTLEQLQLMTW